MKQTEGSPRRRSIFNRVSLHVRQDEDQNDDEVERAALLAEDKSQAVSQFSTPRTVSTPSSTTGSISSPQKEHFQGCLKLFAENKINKDNAWNLQLIDFMSAMLRKHDSRMENLQVASTTLDASTRIYSFRVDAVHYDVLKMAGGLTKASQAKRGKKPDGEEDESNQGEGADADGNTQRKKEKRKKTAKGSLSTNVESQLNAEVEMNECIDPFFAQLAATTGDMTSSNRAFNATLPVDDKSLGLILRSDVIFLDQSDESSEGQIDIKKLETFTMKKSFFPCVEENDQLCGPFHGFSIENWNPEDEEANIKSEADKWFDKNLNLSQQAMAFDLNADVEPLPADDGNGFFFDDDHGRVESDEEEMGVMAHGIKKDKNKVVEQIVDMRPSTRADGFLEYSYCSAVIGSWAGPSHWKLKNNVNRVSRFAEKSQTITTVIVKKAPSRKKKQLDFLGEGMTFNIAAKGCPEYATIVPGKIMIARKTLSQGAAWCEKNLKTPIDRGFNLLHFRKFYLKKSVMLRRLTEELASQKDTTHMLNDINDYDYDNDNDISYCPNSQQNDADGNPWPAEEGNEELGGDIHIQNNVIGSNMDMVEPPAKVPKIFIPYAMRAKKVDMKQLKAVTWTILTEDEDGANKENQQNGQANEEPQHVKETNFMTLYKKLPSKLTTNMKESLSVSLSLLAVLHLANEKGLMLNKNINNTDFSISGL